MPCMSCVNCTANVKAMNLIRGPGSESSLACKTTPDNHHYPQILRRRQIDYCSVHLCDLWFFVLLSYQEISVKTIQFLPISLKTCSVRLRFCYTGSTMKIDLFITCLADSYYPRTGIAVVKILEHLGHRGSWDTGEGAPGEEEGRH